MCVESAYETKRKQKLYPVEHQLSDLSSFIIQWPIINFFYAEQSFTQNAIGSAFSFNYILMHFNEISLILLYLFGKWCDQV